ncbi:MAG: hypothetical protein MPL62_01750 [Alphaproteobacteria bacterium]|nr:hypothetical protein [Alphaproteobacteria bacterium]
MTVLDVRDNEAPPLALVGVELRKSQQPLKRAMPADGCGLARKKLKFDNS